MVKDLVANSPFIDIRFIESGSKLNNLGSEAIFDYYKLDANTLKFLISRDFTDYRITPYFSKDQIKDLKIENFHFDSLSYFQISQFLNQNTFSSIEIVKSDISVYLELPDSYESYLSVLSKKNRHELKRKKRIFVDKFGDISFEKSKNRLRKSILFFLKTFSYFNFFIFYICLYVSFPHPWFNSF